MKPERETESEVQAIQRAMAQVGLEDVTAYALGAIAVALTRMAVAMERVAECVEIDSEARYPGAWGGGIDDGEPPKEPVH